MRHVILISVVLSGLGIGLIGCRECGPSAEPVANLSFNDSTVARIDTLYAIDALRPLPLLPYTTAKLTTGIQLSLPLNLNTDSTRYVFRIGGRQDTITVYYKRNYSYRDTKCGYVLNLTEPAGQKARTTRGKVVFVFYQQNSYISGFLASERNTGISLTVKL